MVELAHVRRIFNAGRSNECTAVDEPTAYLDTALSPEFMDIVKRLKDRGKTAIIASHDPLVYSAPAVDDVVSLRDGKIDGNAE